MAVNLVTMVEKQIARVLEKGARYERFDQLRQRHIWATYLFAHGAGNDIAAGPYELFKVTESMIGAGYPVPVTVRETSHKAAGRVPDNQNLVIHEIGVSLIRPPGLDNDGEAGIPDHAPANGIWANLPAGIQALIASRAPIHPGDAANILGGMVLEMQYLTNNVPIGLLADFSQSAGVYAQSESVAALADQPDGPFMGDPSNGVPAAAFRRKFDVPILLQHGEACGMRLNVPRAIHTRSLVEGGAGWVEVRVDWWVSESFAEKS